MMGFEIGIAILFAVILAGCGWALICNHRTFQDRQQMLRSIEIGRDDFWQLINRLRSVSYDQHLWYRLTLRDPHTLYPDA